MVGYSYIVGRRRGRKKVPEENYSKKGIRTLLSGKGRTDVSFFDTP
jgi:hypothetical protein